MPAETDRPVKRTSVPLTGRDLRDLELIRNSPEAMRAAGAPDGASEAALLSAALRAGLEHLREVAEEAGYAALAASYQDDPQEQAVEVANNRRNRNLPSVLAVRITTSRKPDIPSVVALGSGDPLVGSVLCDEVGPLWGDEVQADAGALSPGTMRAVEAGLHDALGLAN